MAAHGRHPTHTRATQSQLTLTCQFLGNLAAGLGVGMFGLFIYTIIAVISIVHLYKSTKKHLAGGSDSYYDPRSPR